jgi:glycosyltransferase involved in cell wall biosynthesis
MYFVHHGLSEDFINLEPKKINEDEKIRIGLSGNWLRKDIDTNCLLKIIRDNPNITFEMWGSYKIDHSNIGGASSNEMDDFIDQLQVENNVHLHGAVHPRELAIQFQRMDCFLICYDILKDHSNGINYHKIMEYLSTGKVIISNNISSYKNLPGLIEMTESRDNNNELPSLFKKVLENLPDYNSKEKMKKRIFFAQSNSYSKRIEQLEGILSEFQVSLISSSLFLSLALGSFLATRLFQDNRRKGIIILSAGIFILGLLLGIFKNLVISISEAWKIWMNHLIFI